jgi:SsrA-binding protein
LRRNGDHEVARDVDHGLVAGREQQHGEELAIRQAACDSGHHRPFVAVPVSSEDQDATPVGERLRRGLGHRLVPNDLRGVEVLWVEASVAAMVAMPSTALIEAHRREKKTPMRLVVEHEALGQPSGVRRIEALETSARDRFGELARRVESHEPHVVIVRLLEQRAVHGEVEAPTMLPVAAARELRCVDRPASVVVEGALIGALEHLKPERERTVAAGRDQVAQDGMLKVMMGGRVVVLAHTNGIRARCRGQEDAHARGRTRLGDGCGSENGVGPERRRSMRAGGEQEGERNDSHVEGLVGQPCYEEPMAKRKKKEAPPPVEAYGDKIVARNKRASFDYELGERFEAGLVLAGTEVKMLREVTADLSDAYIRITRGEGWVHGINIPERQGSPWSHPAKRSRKLLLHKHELEQIQRATEREGMTCVATRLYFRRGLAKLEIALARGKAKVDKRQSIKQRDADQEARAAIAKHLR